MLIQIKAFFRKFFTMKEISRRGKGKENPFDIPMRIRGTTLLIGKGRRSL
jgi:hypothetical protein